MKQQNNYYKYIFVIIICAFAFSVHAKTDDAIPEKGARYVFKTYAYDISNGTYTAKVHLRKIIYNKLGEKYKNTYVVENKATKVKNVKLQVFSEEGKLLYKKQKKDFNKSCGYGAFGGYDDDCIYYYYADAPQFPYIIDLEYTEECNSLFHIRGENFQEYIPVDSVSYIINSNEGSAIYSKLYSSNEQPLISEFSGITSYQWTLTNIPALKTIKYLPADAREEIRLSIIIENLSLNNYALPEVSWHGIGLWYNQLYDGKCNANPIPETLSIEDAYNSVIENVRYVAIEIDVGGWQPYDAALTESRGFGDCKDMSTLLVSRLQDQNIITYPVLVLTRDNGRIDTTFPNMQFNHVITVAIDGDDTTWMDPTCNTCPYGELPDGDEDIDVLVITEDGGVIRRTPAGKPDDNLIIRNTSLLLTNERSVQITSQSVMYGLTGRYYRNRLIDKTKAEKKEFLEKYINRSDSEFKLESFSFKNYDDITKPFEINIKASTIKQIDKIGNKWYINPYMFFREKNITKVKTADRVYPINFGYPDKVIDSILILMDTTIQVDSVICVKPDSVITKDFLFTTDIKQIGDTLKCVVTKAQKTYQINPEQFLEYELFYKKFKKLTSKYIKLYIQ